MKPSDTPRARAGAVRPVTLFGFTGRWPAGTDLTALTQYARQLGGNGSTDEAGQSACFAPFTCTHRGVKLALAGRAVFGANEARVDNVATAQQLIEAYLQNGSACLTQLHGAFALVLMDEAQERALLAIDRMGIQRLTFATVGEGLAFGDCAEAVARFPMRQWRLRNQAFFDYLLLHMVPATGTVYEGVQKLRAGTCAVFERGRLSIQRYWSPEFVERGAESFEHLRDGLHAGLLAAVKECQPDERTGAFLSGGLDSSTVAGFLARASQRPARTFSIGFGVESYNELAYARIAANHFGCQSEEYHVTADDVVEAFPKIAAAYDEPFGNSSAVPTYFCAQLARRHGYTHLLAGDGGDEIFAGNERYARQRLFEFYRRLPGWLRSSLVEPLARRFDPEHGPLPLRKFSSYVAQASIALPERLESWNYIYRSDTSAMLEADYLAGIDTRAPLRAMEEVFQAPERATSLNRMMFFDWQYTLSDNDLRKVGTMCALAGVQVSYPMLDRRVIDLSLRVPSARKMRGSQLRSFYKEAMKGFLPQQILDKSKHGFGLPFGVWVMTHRPLTDLIFSQLSDLKSRRIVRPQFIDTLLDLRGSDNHPDYLGTAIWDLAMLEAWLKVHARA